MRRLTETAFPPRSHRTILTRGARNPSRRADAGQAAPAVGATPQQNHPRPGPGRSEYRSHISAGTANASGSCQLRIAFEVNPSTSNMYRSTLHRCSQRRAARLVVRLYAGLQTRRYARPSSGRSRHPTSWSLPVVRSTCKSPGIGSCGTPWWQRRYLSAGPANPRLLPVQHDRLESPSWRQEGPPPQAPMNGSAIQPRKHPVGLDKTPDRR